MVFLLINSHILVNAIFMMKKIIEILNFLTFQARLIKFSPSFEDLTHNFIEWVNLTRINKINKLVLYLFLNGIAIWEGKIKF